MNEGKMLVVIDMQNDFITGPLGSEEAKVIVPNVIQKIKDYKSNSYTIFYTQDTHDKSNYHLSHEGKRLPIEHCIYNTEGWKIVPEIYDEINGYRGSIRVTKHAFGHSGWHYINDEVNTIEIIGVCIDICVVSNALILRSVFPEADIIVDASCCAGTTVENHNKALDVMECCHIDIINR